MLYEEFKKEVVAGLEKHYGDSAVVDTRQINKNNCVVEGLQIQLNDPEKSICPVIYLNDIYKDYEDERWDDIQEAVNFIIGLNERHSEEGNVKFSELIHLFDQWEYAKDHVLPMLVPLKNNEEYISELVHKQFLDFAVIYYISGIDSSDGSYSIKISPQLLDRLGVTLEELDNQARINNESEKYSIMSMYNTLMNLIGENEDDFQSELEDESNNMYVLSSKEIHYGAAGILNPEVLSRAEGYVGNNFYIIPSSIYEVILVPNNDSISIEAINEMIGEVNATQVPTQDILSDHVYCYESGEISIAA